MSLPAFSVRNPVLVNMLMLVVLAGGAMIALTLTREMFPESRPNKILVAVVYAGVQPQEIERAVTIKIEEAVRDIDGVEKLESTITEGISTTVITLLPEVDDADVVLAEIKNDVDALQDLPDDLDQIRFEKAVPQLPVIGVAMYGSGSEAQLKRAARRLRDDLLRLPGVSRVSLEGARDDEISIEVRPEKLLQFDVTFDEVAAAIREKNLDISGGELKGDRARVSVRTLGEERRGVDLEELAVRTEPDGRRVLLRDVATVRDAFVETDLTTYFNNDRAINLTVSKTPEQDAIQIATLIKAFVAGKQNLSFDPWGFDGAGAAPWYSKPGDYLRATAAMVANRVSGRADPMEVYRASRAEPFPHSFKVALHTDLARFVSGRLDLMIRNGLQGLILVVISLNLFLNWRVALWAAMGMPIAFMGTFVVMWAMDVSINLLSLFGLIIVLGIIVDDAIVIGENIFRHVEEGMPARQAAIHGAEEVFWPVVVAVSTTIAAFAPLFFLRGQIGDFMKELPLVVTAALTCSLIEALIILPAHLAHLPAIRRAKGASAVEAVSLGSIDPNGRAALETQGVATTRSPARRSLVERLAVPYERFLRMALRSRYITLAFAVTCVILSAGLIAGNIVPAVFVQKMDSESLICNLEMPVGTPANLIRDRLQAISRFATSQPEVVNVQMNVARQYDIAGAGAVGASDSSHLGQLFIELKEADKRQRLGGRSSEALLVELRRLTGSLPGVNSVTWESLNGGPGGRDIEVNVSGPDFPQNLAASEELKLFLAGFDGVFDLDGDFEEGKREVRLRLLASGRPVGVTVSQLGRHVRAATYGVEAKRMTRDREDVRIMVRYPERFRTDIYHIESMYLPTPGPAGERSWVPLSQVAELTEGPGISSLHRTAQQRSVTVFGNTNHDTVEPAELIAQVKERFVPRIENDFPGVRLDFRGSAEENAKAVAGLKIAFPVAMLLIYMMLAGLFRNYFQPMVVMAAIPFGFLGAVLGHWITGHPLTILSWIGLVALTGIVVNDSLVLVDFINSRIREGLSPFEASIEGAKLRLRAILLTTLTTVAGLTPLMFETSFQAKFLIPMAVTLTFGLMMATVLTLVLVPAINLIFFDVQGLARRFLLAPTPIDERHAAVR